MLNQDDKWFIMTTIGVPWTEFEKISDKDQKFLLSKAKELRAKMEMQTSTPQPQNLRPPNYS